MKLSKKGLSGKVKLAWNKLVGLDTQYKVILGIITIFILMGFSFWTGMTYSRSMQKITKTSQEALDEGISNPTKKEFVLGTIEEVSDKEITVKDRKKEDIVIKINDKTKISKKEDLKEGREVIVKAEVVNEVYTAETISVRPE